MAFIFSTSHLPETRVRRPDHLEDEEEAEPSLRDRLPQAARRANAVSHLMQLMPRAGGVRAFSHLPQPLPRQADSEGPLSTRRATPVGRPRPPAATEADTDHAPEPDADPDDAPEADSAPHEPEDDRPWHRPRITTQDLPPQLPNDDAHAPGLNRSATSTRDNGFAPSPQDFRDAFHSPAPDSSAGKDSAQNNKPALPYGRLFEKRLPPGFRDPGAGQFQSLTDKPGYHDLIHRPKSSPEDEQNQRSVFFQNLAGTQYLAQARTGTRQTQPATPARPAKGGATSAQTPRARPWPNAARSSRGCQATEFRNRHRAARRRLIGEIPSADAEAAPGTASKEKAFRR